MNLSAWVSVSDLLPEKKSGFERFIFDRFIKQRIFSKNNPQDILLALKKSGVSGIELLVCPNVENRDIQKIQKILKELDMDIFSLHQSISTLFNIRILEITNLFEIANKLSAKVVVLHINVIGDQIFDQKYINSLKLLEKQYKIKIAIENSPISFLSLFKTYSWKEEEFVSLMKKTGFSITLDTTHLAQTGKDIINFYKNNKDKIINIHLSDYKKSFLNKYLLLAYDTHLPLEKGELPIKDFLETLAKNQYNGLITMEIDGNLESLCKSANFCRLHFKNSSDALSPI